MMYQVRKPATEDIIQKAIRNPVTIRKTENKNQSYVKNVFSGKIKSDIKYHGNNLSECEPPLPVAGDL